MGERPKTLPTLDARRLSEIEDLVRYESSIAFYSARAHESVWMLIENAKRCTEKDLREFLETVQDWFELIPGDDEASYASGIIDTLKWVLGDGGKPQPTEPDWCRECQGQGGWSTPIEDAHGRSLDLDHECPRCDGSRVEP